MPFVSRAQQRYAFATDQPWAKEFAAKTNFKGLPQHVRNGKPVNGTPKKKQAKRK